MADTWHIDYSAKQLSSSVIKSTPVGPEGEKPTGVIRYIDDITKPSLVRTKHITKAEYEDFRRNGVRMDAMYMEVTEDDPLGGYARGQEFARRAKAGADYLGYAGPILFCCDRWFVAKDRPTITVKQWQDFLNGAKSILGDRTGGYGFSDAADAAKGIVQHFVQCGSRSVLRSWVNGWQDNNFKPVVGGIQTDRVLIIRPFSTSEENMPTPDDYAAAVVNRLMSTRVGTGEPETSITQFYSTMVRWTQFDAAKINTVIAAFNALGAQLAQVFTAIDAKLDQIIEAQGGEVGEASTSAQRVHELAEDLQALLQAVPETPQLTATTVEVPSVSAAKEGSE